MDTLLTLRNGALAALVAILALYGIAGLTDIDPGEVGLQVKKIGANKGILPDTLDTGLHWIEPFRYDVVTYDTRQRQYDITEMPSNTKDGQPINVDVSIEIGLIDKDVPALHERIGRHWYEQVVFPALRASIRNTTTYWLSDTVYTAEGRRDIQSRVQRELREHISPYGMTVAVNLRDIIFKNEDFVKTLEEKAKAAQRVTIEQRNAEAAAQTAIRVANIAEGEKQKRIKAGEAQREELRLQGEGERLQKEEQAKGILAIARAQAEGTRLQVLAYGSGQTYASVKWAENLGPNVKVWGVPTGSPGTSTVMDLNGLVQGAFKSAEGK